MVSEAIKTHLIGLEQEMHLLGTRNNRARMEDLLHEEFREFGRSGIVYSRNEILTELAGESEMPGVGMIDVSCAAISEDTVLLTYTSFHKHKSNEGEQHSRFNLRASLWIKQKDTWRLRFHQGTPKAEPG